MGMIMSEKFETLDDLFLNQLEDVYDAEKRLTSALPKMKEAATASELQAAFDSHLKETEGHVARLEQVFQTLGKQPERETCDAMKGLISEGEEAINAKAPGDVHDAALIAAAQRVEHYEIAAYGTLRTLANQMGRGELAAPLEKTLEEEKGADAKLTQIAEAKVNPSAA